MAKPQDREWELHCPWRTPPWREIETKVGEELRKWYAPPQELPDKMRTLLKQFGGGTEGGDRSGYA